MTSRPLPTAPWRRNLIVCAAGSFTTIVGMTVILPILPLYVEDLGVTDPAAVTLWSGVAYAATFATAAVTAPLWGHLGDRYGRKPMLIRASLGMAIAIPLTGLAQNVAQLVTLRLLVGLLGGYASGSTILVAAQTPRARSAWALGTLTSTIMAGNIVGPLLGGMLAQTIGFRAAFLATGGMILIAFVGTAVFLVEDRDVSTVERSRAVTRSWRSVSRKSAVLALIGLSALLTFATVSVEPIITAHVSRLTGSGDNVAALAGVIFALAASGSLLSGPSLGRLADRFGHIRVLTLSLAVATGLLAAQAIAADLAAFAVLRFFTGIALGGIMPTVTAAVRDIIPEATVGLVLGYTVSAQYVGQVAGPILAGWIAGVRGTSSVFVATAAATALGLAAMILTQRRRV